MRNKAIRNDLTMMPLNIHTAADAALVSVSCLKHVYPDTTEIHMCGLDFVVKRGERVVVLGGNGSGKTTLLYHILGLLAPDEGSVAVFDVNPAKQYNAIRERIGVLLQNVDDQILSPTVWDDISFSPRNYGYGKEETARMVEQIMAEMGIQNLRDKICHYLSGGEKRKVALAGALVLRPELLILDEPFEGLDSRSRSELVALLNKRNQEGMTIIMFDTRPEPGHGLCRPCVCACKGARRGYGGNSVRNFHAGRGTQGIKH